MTTTATRKFNVGGVLLERPFQIRRLGHIGMALSNYDEGKRFYTDLLGFIPSDPSPRRVPDPKAIEGMGDPTRWFLRYNSDHHALVIDNKRTTEVLNGPSRRRAEVTVGQISWQVQTLRECMEGGAWWEEQGRSLNSIGRGGRGGNYHAYVDDFDGHNNEIFYGMEQIGWPGRSRPFVMHRYELPDRATLPVRREYDEVTESEQEGTDFTSGYRFEQLPGKYDVGGVLLPRPFRIVKHGPIKLFLNDLDKALEFYEGQMGFERTEEVAYEGERAIFLRCATEHHSLALFSMGLRARLGLSPHTTLASLGIQVGGYQQLRDAVAFLRENGVRVETSIVPPALHPGIEYAAYAFDPDGHALELCSYMEQVGWDGHARPASARPVVDPDNWPEAIEAKPDSFAGAPFMGPLA